MLVTLRAIDRVDFTSWKVFSLFYLLLLHRNQEQELLFEREKLEAAFDQQLKKQVGRTKLLVGYLHEV